MKYVLTLLLLVVSLCAAASGNISNHVTLAVQAENRNDLSGAIQHYKNALETRLNKNTRIEIMNNIGVLYFKMKNYQSALSVFDNCRQIDENNALIWNNLGLCYEKTSKINEAENAFMKSIHLKKDYTDPYVNLLNLYYMQGNYQSALETGKKLLTLEPFVPHVLHGLGQICLKMGKYNDAAFYFEETIAIEPAYENSMLELAAIYFDKKDRENFIRIAKNLLAIQPREEILIALAYTYLEIKQYWLSLNYVRKAQKIFPSSINALNVLESLYVAIRNYKGALGVRTKLYLLGEKSQESLFKLALFHQKTGNHKKALEIYLRIQNKSRISEQQRLDMSMTYFSLGKYREVIGFLNKGSHELSQQINLGWAYIRLKDISKAKNHFEALHKKNPQNFKIQENYCLSQILSGKGKLVIHHLFELREQSDSPFPSLYISLQYLLENRIQLAEKYFIEALMLDSNRQIDYTVDILQEKSFSVFIKNKKLKSLIDRHFNSPDL